MTPEEVELIRSNFAQLARSPDAGRLFYQRLFVIAPELRTLFKGDMDAQSRKLMETLAVAVSALRDTPVLVRVLQDLGTRHRSYGVRPEHYPKVGAALVDTLEQVLGPAFDARVRETWLKLYGFIASTMEPRTASSASRH